MLKHPHVFRWAIAAGVVLLCCFAVSCKKKKETTLMVSLQDANGKHVPKARVWMYAEPDTSGRPTRFNHTLRANFKGDAYFNFDDHYRQDEYGFVILTLYAWNPDSTAYASTTLKVIEEEEHKKTMVLVP